MEPARQLELLHRVLALKAENTSDRADASYRNPVRRYVDPADSERERRQLFRRQPVLAALSCDVRDPGQYVTLRVGGVPVVVVRGPDGVVRAFHNVCRHRGSQVCEGSGTVRTFVCPYHSWTYGLDGALVSVRTRTGFDDLDITGFELAPIACDEAAGMVFVRVDSEGLEPLDAAAWLAGVDGELAPFDFASYHLVEVRHNARRMNWKLAFDTFCEVHHIQSLHGATIAPLVMSHASVFDAFGPHGRVLASRWSVDELEGADPADWRLLPHATLLYLLAPATVLIYQQDHVELWQIEPGDDPDHCTMTISLYAPEAPTTDKARSYWRKNMDLLMKVTDDEDFVMCEQIQNGFHSGAQDEIVFGRVEPGLIHFHRSLESLLGDR